MKEARLTCRVRSYHVADLHLDMVRGDVEYIDAERALASKDLTTARQAHAIEVYITERSREKRIAPPPPSRAAPPPKQSKAIGQAPRPAIPPGLSPEEVDALIRARLADFKGDMRGLLEEMLPLPAVAPDAARASSTGTVAATPSKAEDPSVFIPSRIMGSQKADITVEETETAGDSVDAAAAALKAAREENP